MPSEIGLITASATAMASNAGSSTRVAAIGPLNRSRTDSKLLSLAIWAPTGAFSLMEGGSSRILRNTDEPKMKSSRPATNDRMRERCSVNSPPSSSAATAPTVR